MDNKSSPSRMVNRSSLGRHPKHQRRSTCVYGNGQDEPDGRGVAVADELRAQVLQGEGGVAVGGHAGVPAVLTAKVRSAAAVALSKAGRVTMPS